MRAYVAFLPSRRSRAVLAILLASTAAGCSSDVTRFHSEAYAKRNGVPQSEATGSISNRTVAAAPAGRVERAPLPQAGAVQTVPAQQAATSDLQARSGGGPGLGTYRPPETTGSIQAPPPAPARVAAAPAPVAAPAPTAAPAPAQQWTWNGGTPIIVGSNDNLDSIAKRHGVPASAILQANNLRSATSIQPGQRIVIPRYASSAPAAPATATPRTAAALPGTGTTHVVAPGETLTGIARRYGKTVTEVAKASRIEPHARVAMGDRLTIPGGAQPAAVARNTAPQAAPQQPAPRQVVSAEPPTPTARAIAPAAEQPKADEPAAKAADAAGSLPGFRWPARGRVITGFGPKPNGQQNDGINLALPEGTPIKAADDGVVAYAGNELKGYGNLVLVRHANGYVTAYAHASELNVKRGDNIKRGQVLGRVGQTGNVTSPQLHFEIRKGATPVDPMQFLSGA